MFLTNIKPTVHAHHWKFNLIKSYKENLRKDWKKLSGLLETVKKSPEDLLILAQQLYIQERGTVLQH